MTELAAYALRSELSRGRRHAEPAPVNRSEFQRDRDRGALFSRFMVRGHWRRARAITLAIQMRSGQNIGEFGTAVDAKLDEVIEKLTDNRGSSLVVVDENNKPLGRIMADDVVDAMVQKRGSHSWPWQEGRG